MTDQQSIRRREKREWHVVRECERMPDSENPPVRSVTPSTSHTLMQSAVDDDEASTRHPSSLCYPIPRLPLILHLTQSAAAEDSPASHSLHPLSIWMGVPAADAGDAVVARDSLRPSVATRDTNAGFSSYFHGQTE